MTQKVAVDFLNWFPDQDAGMTEADNVLHDTEGYNQLLKQTAGAFSTATPVGATATYTAMRIRPAGVASNRLYAALTPKSTTAAMNFFVIGDNDTGDQFTLVSTGTLTALRACRIKSFCTTDTPDGILVTAQITADLAAGTTTTQSLTVLAVPI